MQVLRDRRFLLGLALCPLAAVVLLARSRVAAPDPDAAGANNEPRLPARTVAYLRATGEPGAWANRLVPGWILRAIGLSETSSSPPPRTVAGLSGARGWLEVSAVPFASRSPAGARLFTRKDGATLGIDLPMDAHFLKLMMPFENMGSGIASGDVDHDGYADLLIVYNGWPVLYANREGRFAPRPIGIERLDGATVLNGALVDLDGDGWLDLYLATFGHGAWVARSDRGRFTAAAWRKLPLGDDRAVPAVAGFGDLDGDSRLDIVIGRWEFVFHGIRASARSTPVLLLSRGNGYAARELPVYAGVPNAVILTDFDLDAKLDVVLGLDFDPSDQYLRGDGRGGFRVVKRSEGIIPITAYSTMGFAAADVDNDLRPELFVVGWAKPPAGARRVVPPEVCTELETAPRRRECEQGMHNREAFREALRLQEHAPERCRLIASREARDECLLFSVVTQRRAFPDAEVCRGLPRAWKEIAGLCYAFRGVAPLHPARDFAEDIPQRDDDHVLLVAGKDGKFVDRARELGIARSGLTWNAKFADLDNDGWVDLYAVQGWFRFPRFQSNYFFHNDEGRHFSERTAEVGLESHFPTLAYTYVDLDNDGDLDIVTVPTFGPIWVYVNNSQASNAVQFELSDLRTANRFGVGARMTAYSGERNAPAQMRTIEASGGYQSFDEPVAHFGLGDGKTIARLEIDWPDGTRSKVDGPFAAGFRYRISRPAGTASLPAPQADARVPLP